MATLADVIDRLKKEGELTRNSGTNSNKTIINEIDLANVELGRIKNVLSGAQDYSKEPPPPNDADEEQAVALQDIAYQLNSFNLGTNPNKFFEYSAMGIPCISTDIPSLRKFLPHLSIAHTTNEWANLIEKAFKISDANRKELRALAKFYSPKESLERIDQLLS